MSDFFIRPRNAEQAEIDAEFAPPAPEPERRGGFNLARVIPGPPQALFNVLEDFDINAPEVLRSGARGGSQLLGGVSETLGRIANIPNNLLETPDYLLPTDPVQREATRRITDPTFHDRTAAARAFEGIVESNRRARRTGWLRRDPRPQSEATEILGGLAEVMTPALIGGLAGPGGAGAALAFSTEERTYTDLLEQGVRDNVARSAALQDAGFMAAMGVAPISVAGTGRTLLTRLLQRGASGAAINLAFGAAMRGNMGAYLTEQGYPELAEQYQWLDGRAALIDGVMGAAFGAWFGHSVPNSARPHAIDGEIPAREDSEQTLPQDANGYFEEARQYGNDQQFAEAYGYALIARELGHPEADGLVALLEEDSSIGPADLEQGRAIATEIIDMDLAQGVRGSDIQAAALIEADAINRETAFGVPVDNASRRWASEAQTRMEEQAANGERIDPGPQPDGVEFVPMPERGAPEWDAAFEAYIREGGLRSEAEVEATLARMREENGPLFSFGPRRRGVGDERGSERFNDDRLNAQQNKAVEMRRNGLPPGEAADEMQVSEARYRELLREARDRGVEVARAQPGPPRTVRNEVLRLTRENPTFTSAKIAERVRSMGHETTARGVRRAWEMLRAEGALPPAAGPRQRGPLFSMGRPIFESAVERVVAESRTARASGAQWWATISKATGVKREELEWIGLEDWLKAEGRDSVTREEVLQFVRENGVRVEETVLGGDGADAAIQRQMLPLIEENDRLAREFTDIQSAAPIDPEHGRNRIFTEEQQQRLSEISARRDVIDVELGSLRGAQDNLTNKTRWSQYTLPGGENYRELLLRLPAESNELRALMDEHQQLQDEFAALDNRQGGRASEIVTRLKEIDAASATLSATFRSSHFDQPNILAHVRFNERTDANGARTLFIEEVQSDWHQAGRERGYMPSQADLNNLTAEKVEGRGAYPPHTPFDRLLIRDGTGHVVLDTVGHDDASVTRAMEEARSRLRDGQFQSVMGGRVPDAPFKNNAWANLAMKRMIRWAAENGFEQIAWTRGQHQIERFNLAQYVTRLAYRPEQQILSAYDSAGREVIRETVPPERVGEYVGKEAAEQLLATKPEAGIQRIETDAIETGGSGMRAFYDRIMVNIANDLGKKFGARVGETEVAAATDRPPTMYRDERVITRDGINYVRDTKRWQERLREIVEPTVEFLATAPKEPREIRLINEIKAIEAKRVERVGQGRTRGAGAGGYNRDVGAISHSLDLARQQLADFQQSVPREGSETVHSLPITPQMREAAMEGQALFSQSAREGFSTPEELEALGNELGVGWAAMRDAGQVRIVQESAQVPAPMGLPRGVNAVHMRDTGTTYFVANNIRPEDFYGLILHEVGVHHGMENMLGKRGFKEVLRQIDRMVEEEHPALVEARALAERYAANEAHIPEETLAYLIETHADLPLVNRILSRLRQWLIKTFGSTFGMRLTVDDLRALAITSLRRVAEQARREGSEAVEVLPVQEAVLASQGPDAGPVQRGSATTFGELPHDTQVMIVQNMQSDAAGAARLRAMGLIDENGVPQPGALRALANEPVTRTRVRVADLGGERLSGAQQARAAEYAGLDTAPPPIAVRGQRVLDGNRRLEAARQRGETEIDAYDVSNVFRTAPDGGSARVERVPVYRGGDAATSPDGPRGQWWDQDPEVGNFYAQGDAPVVYRGEVDPTGYQSHDMAGYDWWSDNGARLNQIIKQATDDGAPGVRFTNLADATNNAPRTQYFAIDRNSIRTPPNAGDAQDFPLFSQRGQNGENLLGAKRDPIESPEYQRRIAELRGEPQGEDGRAGRGDASLRAGEEGKRTDLGAVIAVSGLRLQTRPNGSDFGTHRATIDTPIATDADAILQAKDGAEGKHSVVDFDFIDGNNPKEVRLPGVHIRWTRINDAAKGKGIGVWIYRQLIDWADRQGLPVYSDFAISGEAQPIYGALARRGYNVEQINPHVKGSDGFIRNQKYQPIFRISRTGVEVEYEAAPPPREDYQIDGPSLRERQTRIDEQRARQEEYDKKSAAERAAADDPDAPMFSFGPGRRRLSARELMEEAKLESEAARDMRKGFEAAARCAARHGAGQAVRASAITLGWTPMAALDAQIGHALGMLWAIPVGLTVAPILARAGNPRRYAERRLQAAAASLEQAEARVADEASVAGVEAGLDAPSDVLDMPEGESASELAFQAGEDRDWAYDREEPVSADEVPVDEGFVKPGQAIPPSAPDKEAGDTESSDLARLLEPIINRAREEDQ